MDIETLQDFCNSLPCVEAAFPFDEETLAFKVGGKIFLLTTLFPYRWVNVKCDPDKAIELRERYTDVLPGYHMNKRHWNTLQMHGTLSDVLVKQWITDSYALVVKSLPKSMRSQNPELSAFIDSLDQSPEE